MDPIPYGKHQIDKNDIDSVIEVLKSDFLTQGPKIEEFELKFAKYIGSKHAITVSNGTAALHLSSLVLGVNKTSKVITSPISFVATANCIEYCGGEVEFCDINPDTLCLDIDLLRKKLEKVPLGTYSGIILVDFAGYAVDMEKFRILADEYNLWLLEDSCHAPGGFYIDSKNNFNKCGNGKFADLAIFSFHPVKHISCGEGGMITTNNTELYEKLKLLRSHGITKDPKRLSQSHGNWFYEMQMLGFNYRLPDLNCALGISQLNNAEINIQKRRKIAEIYNIAFRGLPIQIPEQNYSKGHAFHLYVILTDKRKELFNFLKRKNILAQIHYIPIHTMPYYVQKYGKQKFMNSENYYDKCISLPIFPSLTKEEQNYIIKSIKLFFNEIKQ